MNNVIPLPVRDPGPHPSPAADDGSATVARAVWTVKEAAELLSLSLGSTYALIRSGEIPAIRLGGRWLIPKRRFQEWLNSLPEASTEDAERELSRLDR